HLLFDDAMREGNRDLAQRLLEYASWCLSERAGDPPNHTATAALYAFYEHLPENRSYWPLFPEWFSPDEFHGLLPCFAYHLSEQDISELRAYYRKPRTYPSAVGIGSFPASWARSGEVAPKRISRGVLPTRSGSHTTAAEGTRP